MSSSELPKPFDANNNNNNQAKLLDEAGETSCVAAGSPASSKQALMCDRNKDSERVDVSGSMLSVGGGGGGGDSASEKCRRTSARDATSGRQNASSLANASDWHLLDVDGQSVAASSTCSSCNELNLVHEKTQPLQGGKSGHKMATSNEKATRKSYQLANGNLHPREALSPTLVHACTLLYALLPLASILAFVTLLGLLFTNYWLITICYYSYLLLDSRTCNRGGRRIEAVYKSKFWKYLAAHFPIQLKYSATFKLDPNENYILNYHPHGISAFGCVSAFATDGLNFTKLFPGIKSHFMVHETSFLVPVMRETFSLRGDCSVNSKSFDHILSKKWQHTRANGKAEAGYLLALCGGGLAEADLSDAKTLKIVVATRKGFVKKALIHGANLIPCIAFGENSVFTKINLKPNSLLQRLESRFYSLFKFKHPIYYGASALGTEKLSGVMPYKRPITVVMGDPIEVERTEEPSQEQIDRLHAKYMSALRSVYADNQKLCTKYDIKLELV